MIPIAKGVQQQTTVLASGDDCLTSWQLNSILLTQHLICGDLSESFHHHEESLTKFRTPWSVAA